jgi:hypothetical protein
VNFKLGHSGSKQASVPKGNTLPNKLSYGVWYESRQPAETLRWVAMGKGQPLEGAQGKIDDPELIRDRTRKSAEWAKDALAWTAGPSRIAVLRRGLAKGAIPKFKMDHTQRHRKGPVPPPRVLAPTVILLRGETKRG